MIERNMLLSGEIARITRHMTNCVIHTSSRVHAELTKIMINEKLKGMSNAEQLFCVFPELGILHS